MDGMDLRRITDQAKLGLLLFTLGAGLCIPAFASGPIAKPDIEKAMLPLDSLAAAVCSNVCTVPILPFNGVILLKSCDQAMTMATGGDELWKLVGKSPALSKLVDNALESQGITGGQTHIKGLVGHYGNEVEKDYSCATGVLFTIIAGARSKATSAKNTDFSCLKDGLTDNGCDYSSAQLATEMDAQILFQAGLDRALASFFKRTDPKILSQKIADDKNPSALVEYLSDLQGGEFPASYKELYNWGREHAQETLMQVKR
jgi:hypothetical protein